MSRKSTASKSSLSSSLEEDRYASSRDLRSGMLDSRSYDWSNPSRDLLEATGSIQIFDLRETSYCDIMESYKK